MPEDVVVTTEEGTNAGLPEVALDTPVEQTPGEEGAPVEPVEETTEEKKTELELPHGEVDPEFNCPDCKGDGLKSQTEICPTCKGTGKV